MSTVDPLVSFVETLKFGDFPKLLRLCEDKFTKSNRTTWSKRSEDKKKKYITCLSKVVNIVSGGETTIACAPISADGRVSTAMCDEVCSAESDYTLPSAQR